MSQENSQVWIRPPGPSSSPSSPLRATPTGSTPLIRCLRTGLEKMSRQQENGRSNSKENVGTTPLRRVSLLHWESASRLPPNHGLPRSKTKDYASKRQTRQHNT